MLRVHRMVALTSAACMALVLQTSPLMAAPDFQMKAVRSIQARVQGDMPFWDKEHGAFVSAYGDDFASKYRATLDTVNTASVEGALMYVQAEGINQNEQSVECERKNKMEYVVFYDITMVQSTNAVAQYSEPSQALPEYCPFLALDGGKCTDQSPGKLPEACEQLEGINNQPNLGACIGGETRNADPRAPYPDTIWFSLPNSCVTKIWNDKTDECRAEHPGGMCPFGTQPDGVACTFSYKIMGYVKIDDVVGITAIPKKDDPSSTYSNFSEFCNDGNVEFKATKEMKVEESLPFWENPTDPDANSERSKTLVKVYNDKLGDNMEKLPTVAQLAKANPACYENTPICANAAFGCRRKLYSQICEVCPEAADDCVVAPSSFTFPKLAIDAKFVMQPDAAKPAVTTAAPSPTEEEENETPIDEEDEDEEDGKSPSSDMEEEEDEEDDKSPPSDMEEEEDEEDEEDDISPSSGMEEEEDEEDNKPPSSDMEEEQDEEDDYSPASDEKDDEEDDYSPSSDDDTDDTTVKPTVKPTTKPTTKPTAKPTTKPTAKPMTKPTAKPTAKPTDDEDEDTGSSSSTAGPKTLSPPKKNGSDYSDDDEETKRPKTLSPGSKDDSDDTSIQTPRPIPGTEPKDEDETPKKKSDGSSDTAIETPKPFPGTASSNESEDEKASSVDKVDVDEEDVDSSEGFSKKTTSPAHGFDEITDDDKPGKVTERPAISTGSDEYSDDKDDDYVPPVTDAPSGATTKAPKGSVTEAPTKAPKGSVTDAPTEAPKGSLTEAPTEAPNGSLTAAPTDAPTRTPEENNAPAPTSGASDTSGVSGASGASGSSGESDATTDPDVVQVTSAPLPAKAENHDDSSAVPSRAVAVSTTVVMLVVSAMYVLV